MKTIKLRLDYLNNEEQVNMTTPLRFLFDPKSKSKDALIKLADRLYGGDTRFDFVTDNGHPSEADNATSYSKDRHYYTLVRFADKYLTEQAVELLGHSRNWDFRFFYGLSVCKEDRKLYLVSFSNQCCPNWNNEYWAQKVLPLETLDIPVLVNGGTIYAMCRSLHSALNEKLWKMKPLFIEQDGDVRMAVKDQHGNYCYIYGESVDAVFRDYADNYTGYRDYRRPMASEWEIVSDSIRQRYAEWRRTATGLKSSFDKFYRGGIVD